MQSHDVPPRVAAEQAHDAAICFEKPEQHPNGGGLARSVRTQKPVHLAALDSQVQALERLETSEELRQPFDFDHRIRRVHEPLLLKIAAHRCGPAARKLYTWGISRGYPERVIQQSGRPTGRRTGDSGTRDSILDAALALFADHGYDGASVRAIATSAGVDPALIRHFFGDKAGLFAATVADRTAIPERLFLSLAGDPDAIGRRVTEAYLRLWEEPDTRLIMMALVRSASTSTSAAAMLSELLLGAQVRAQSAEEGQLHCLVLAGSHLLGLAFMRHIVKAEPLVAIDLGSLIECLAPTIQRYLSAMHQ